MEYYSEVQVARELTVPVELLRKLSILIEKAEMNPTYFLKDMKKKRLYTVDNITEFERLIARKRELKTSYTALIYAIYGQNKEGNLSRYETNGNQSSLLVYIEKHQEFMKDQNKKMDGVVNSLEKLKKTNAENTKKLTKLNEKIEWITETKMGKKKRNKLTEQELGLGLTRAQLKSGNSMIKREEFKLLRSKVKQLYFRWEEYGKYQYLEKKEYSHYSHYVNESKDFFSQLVHLKKIGKYYVINKAVKEKLIAYGEFYDSLAGSKSTTNEFRPLEIGQ